MQKDHAAQRGRDAFGTATRISASLSRRLSAFFGSTPDQGPKAAKFAVLPPGHAGFPKRVKQSEGSDTTPIRKAPVSPCKPLCTILLAKASVYPLSSAKANVGRFAGDCDKTIFCRVILIDGSRGWVFVTAFERALKPV